MDLMILVTARGGSRRLPGKNLRPLAGRSLLAWTAGAVHADLPDVEVVLSTDAEDIAEEGRRLGWTVPFMRPDELASDDASSLDVALHALDCHAAADGRSPQLLLLLQPTSPFRPRGMLRQAFSMMSSPDAPNAVIAVKRLSVGMANIYRAEEGRLMPVSGGTHSNKACYVPSGALYMIRTDALRHHRSFVPPSTGFIPHGGLSTLDIDDFDDWSLAEVVAENFVEPSIPE